MKRAHRKQSSSEEEQGWEVPKRERRFYNGKP